MSACVQPGAWRRCLACCEGRNPVTAAAQFRIEKCNDCSNSLRLMDLTAVRVGEDTATIYRCKTCSRKHEKFTCTVCNRDRERHEFQDRHVMNRAIRRCNECRICDTCGRFFADAKQFVCNTRRCVNCVTHKCTLCLKFKKTSEFQAKQLEHVRMKQQKKLECKECLASERHACQAPPCKQKKAEHPESSFDPLQIHDMKSKGHKYILICRSCRELGFSSGRNGTTPYRCAECKQNLGHGRFTTKALNNKQQRPKGNLYCKDCKAKQ